MISPPCVEMRSETFAVSMLVPPPTATNPSNPPSTAKSAAACSESSVGSTRALSQTSTSMPSASMSSWIRGAMPAATTPGSETSITRLTPSRLTSQPTSSAAPGPYFRGVASMVNTVSLPEAPFPCTVVRLLSPAMPLQCVFGFFVPFSPDQYTSGLLSHDFERLQNRPPQFRGRFVSASTTARLPLSHQACSRPPSGLSSTIEAALEPHENRLFDRCQLPRACPKVVSWATGKCEETAIVYAEKCILLIEQRSGHSP